MKNLIFVLITILYTQFSYSHPLAFPGAEGGGRFTSGGRGGEVYYVNSLADTIEGNNKTKEGTLRWCLKKPGPRTILFKVAGIIRLKSTLNIPENTTIAGQSAPGDGICIADHTVKIDGDNVIIRYIRFRMGDLAKTQDDALKANNKKNIIVDHCSMSWSTDECASFYDNENFTLQWCILSESLRASVHEKGSHGYGGIWGGQNASFHHNLLAHHDSRNPRMCGSRYTNRADLELVDLRNNVIFNWGSNSGYAGEGGRYNIVNNYYKPSETSSNSTRIFSPNEDDGSNSQAKGIWGKFYLSGNYIVGKDEVNKDNILGFQPNPSTKNKKELLSACEFNVAPVVTDNAEDAFEKVLKGAGASYKRDKTDERIVNETKLGLTPIRASRNKGTKPGLIDTQRDVGGWENYSYKPDKVIIDTNIDGIPDGWLEKNHANKTAKDTNEDGYTYLEVYLNQLVNSL